MKIINFAHPLTDDHLAQLNAQFGIAVSFDDITTVKTLLDPEQPFTPQVVALVDATGVSPDEWQNGEILVVAPSLGNIAALVLAEIEGRSGHFPSLLRLKPDSQSVVPRFVIAEILNLSAQRQQARARR